MKRVVIIVAGGSGLRMGGEVPKQFLVIGGRPVLMHTIQKFHLYDKQMPIILVLPLGQVDYWHSLCVDYDFDIPCQLTYGGNTRFQSVQNGLSLVNQSDTLIAVHDGVRPFVSFQTLDNCFTGAGINGNAIPVIDAFESVRLLDSLGSHAIDRNSVKLVQTPQVFCGSQLIEAYNQPFQHFFTDDASVVEAAGQQIFLTEGNRENIKLTTPFDLKIAQLLLE